MMHIRGSKQAHLTAPVPSPPRTHSSSTTAPPPALAVPMISLPAPPLPLPPLQRRSSASLSSVPSSQRSSLPTTPGHHLPSPSGHGHQQVAWHLQSLLPPTQRTSPVSPGYLRAPHPPVDPQLEHHRNRPTTASARRSLSLHTSSGGTGVALGGHTDSLLLDSAEEGFVSGDTAVPRIHIHLSPPPAATTSELLLPPCAPTPTWATATATTTTACAFTRAAFCSLRPSSPSVRSFPQAMSKHVEEPPAEEPLSRFGVHLSEENNDIGDSSGSVVHVSSVESVLNETVAHAPLTIEPEEQPSGPPRISRCRRSHRHRHREAIQHASVRAVDSSPPHHSKSPSEPSAPVSPVTVDMALPEAVLTMMQGSPTLALRMPAGIPTLNLE